MSWGHFLRREWGAATFVLTVIIGLVAVPLALYIGNQSAGAVKVPITVTPASVASTASTTR